MRQADDADLQPWLQRWLCTGPSHLKDTFAGWVRCAGVQITVLELHTKRQGYMWVLEVHLGLALVLAVFS